MIEIHFIWVDRTNDSKDEASSNAFCSNEEHSNSKTSHNNGSRVHKGRALPRYCQFVAHPILWGMRTVGLSDTPRAGPNRERALPRCLYRPPFAPQNSCTLLPAMYARLARAHRQFRLQVCILHSVDSIAMELLCTCSLLFVWIKVD